MNKLLFTLSLLFLSLFVFAQSEDESRIQELKQDIELIKKQEKEALAKRVDDINNAYDKGLITKSEADLQKRELAEDTAERIEDRIDPLERELSRLEANSGMVDIETDTDKDTSIIGEIKEWGEKIKRGPYTYKSDEKKKKKHRSESRNTSQWIFSWGFNNLANDGDLNSMQNNDLNAGNSHFVEWGYTRKYRLTPNSSLLNLKYGLSFTYNNYRPNDNQYFVKDGNMTQLQTFDLALERDAKLRVTNFVLPVHLEFDFSKSKYVDGEKIVKTQKGMRLGVGGYAGVNYRERQLLRYNDNGIRTEVNQRGNFNVTNFMAGVSGYIGYRDISLYARYELTPLFANNSVDLHPVSIGVRFDWN